VDEEKAQHSVVTLCRVLGVSKSGYYAWHSRGPSRRAQEDADLIRRIRLIHEESRGTYGSPRIHAELRLGAGIRCSKKRVARLMRQCGLQGVSRRKGPCTTRRNRDRQPAPDLVRRDFHAKAPDRLWVADITQHPTGEGWLYTAAILDVFSRRVVGWAMGDHLRAELVIDALNMAIRNRRPPAGLVHHSDHGSQYTSLAFGKRLEDAGILGSMGTVGDALDNAVAESFWATLQTELLDRNVWPTRTVLRSAIFEYIEGFYNRRRRHSTLGYLSPMHYERRWWDEHKLSLGAAS
jgi:putative transposase